VITAIKTSALSQRKNVGRISNYTEGDTRQNFCITENTLGILCIKTTNRTLGHRRGNTINGRQQAQGGRRGITDHPYCDPFGSLGANAGKALKFRNEIG
jgi:hypothetical protein